MPLRLARMTSSSMAEGGGDLPGSIVAPLRHDDVPELVDPGDLARVEDRGAVELLDHRGPSDGDAHVEALAPIDGALDGAAVEPNGSSSPQRILRSSAGGREPAHLHPPDPADRLKAIKNDLHRLAGSHVAEQEFVVLVEC